MINTSNGQIIFAAERFCYLNRNIVHPSLNDPSSNEKMFDSNGLYLQKSGNLEAIQIIKKLGGTLTDSYLDEGKLEENIEAN